MKLAFIVCYEHVKPSLMDMLRALRIDYYTHWEQIKGKGHGTEPHVGTGSYVRMNDALMIAFEDEAPLAELIRYISTFMLLKPGDLIATGTPEGVGPMQVGSTVRVAVPGVGQVENSIVAE